MNDHSVVILPPPWSSLLLSTPWNPQTTSRIVLFNWDITFFISNNIYSDSDFQPWQWAYPPRGKGFIWNVRKREVVFWKIFPHVICVFGPQRNIASVHIHLMWKASLPRGKHGGAYFQSFFRWALRLEPHSNNTINTLAWITAVPALGLLLLLLQLSNEIFIHISYFKSS